MNRNGTIGEQGDGEGSEPSTVDSQEVDSMARWVAAYEDHVVRRRECATVAKMAEKLGVPEWHIFKVVLGETEQMIVQTHQGSAFKAKLGLLVMECVLYAKHCTREDGFKPVWTSKSLDYIRDAARAMFAKN